ncbi:MAG: tetratricopeptide repeat protein [Pirellulaceae bacterium]
MPKPKPIPPKKSNLRLWSAVLILVGLCAAMRPTTRYLCDLRFQENLDSGDLTTARRWLDSQKPWGLSEADWHLKMAKLQRTGGDWTAWQSSITAAKEQDAPLEAIAHEQQFMRLSQARPQDLQQIDSFFSYQNVPLPEIYATILPGVLSQGRFDLADSLLSQWFVSQPHSASAHYWSALRAELQGDVLATKSELTAALEASPLHALARRASARLALSADKLNEAHQFYWVLAYRDSDVSGYAGLAEVLRRSGAYQAAKQVIETCPSDHAGSMEIVVQKGLLAAELGDYQQAEQCLEAVLANDQRLSEEAESGLAVSLHLSGADDKAQQLLKRVAEETQRSHEEKEDTFRQD